jgi:hypothetical protein
MHVERNSQYPNVQLDLNCSSNDEEPIDNQNVWMSMQLNEQV